MVATDQESSETDDSYDEIEEIEDSSTEEEKEWDAIFSQIKPSASHLHSKHFQPSTLLVDNASTNQTAQEEKSVATIIEEELKSKKKKRRKSSSSKKMLEKLQEEEKIVESEKIVETIEDQEKIKNEETQNLLNQMTVATGNTVVGGSLTSEEMRVVLKNSGGSKKRKERRLSLKIFRQKSVDETTINELNVEKLLATSGITDQNRSLSDLSDTLEMSHENQAKRKAGAGSTILQLFKSKKSGKSEQKRAATKFQALWRGYSLRKKLKSYGSTSILLRQLLALRQIVEIDTAYLSNLCIIIENYLKPLIEYNKYNEQARKALPMAVIKSIFRNIESIYNLHVHLIKDLEDRITKWPFVNDIPAILLRVTGGFSIYGRYAEEAATAEETLSFFKQKPPLSIFLNKMYNERLHFGNIPNRSKIADLSELLELPYHHLNKLFTVFTIYMNATPSNSPDYSLIADSVAILSQLHKFIWNKAEENISERNMKLLMKIQNCINDNKELPSKPRIITLNPNQKITKDELVLQQTKEKSNKKERISGSLDNALVPTSNKKSSKKSGKRSKSSSNISGIAAGSGPVASNSPSANSASPSLAKNVNFEIYKENRKLVRRGILLFGKEQKERQVYLFNDICLIVQVIASHKSIFEASFELKTAKLHSNSVSLPNNSQTFHIKANIDDFVFTEKLDEPISWIITFEELIRLSQDEIFGVHLEEILKRENSYIPKVVIQIIQNLTNNITNPELFRCAINAKSVQSLRDPSLHHKLHTSNINDVLGLLILYLDQLPDILLLYESNDPIFTAQSTPNEETLLSWISKHLDKLPTPSKNLLEYLMSFLSKVLAHSVSNGVTSTDLSVIFSPLVFKPKELTLEYCFKMARVSRLVKIMIEKANDIFTVTDSEVSTLPNNLEEFLKSDQFGGWWRDFRQKKSYFIEFISQPSIIHQLVNYIIQIPENESMENDDKFKNQFASLSYGILANDGVVANIFQHLNLLTIIIQQFNGQTINERANKYFCDFIEILLRGNPEKMYEFICKFPSMNEKLINSIGSGNFCNMILGIAETWNSNTFIHKIIIEWAIVGLSQLLTEVDTPESDILANTVRFLRFLVRTTAFIQSQNSKRFISDLSDREFLNKFIKRILEPDYDSAICIMPLIIELLVQYKNKNPQINQQRQQQQQAANENNPNHEEAVPTSEDVPLLITVLLEKHLDIVQFLKEPLDIFKKKEEEKKSKNGNDNSKNQTIQPPPLGFFRFGLIKLIQALLITNYPFSNYLIASTELISICLELFFLYYKHSILHSVVTYIVRYIMAIGNKSLIELLIIKCKLPEKIIETYQLNNEILDNLRGHLKIFAIAIHNSVIAEEILKTHHSWHDFVVKVLLTEETNSKTQIEVALAQKKLARSNLTKQEFTDQLEDKIAQ